jgi:N-acetylglucosamine-6-phosphate deacetylase
VNPTVLRAGRVLTPDRALEPGWVTVAGEVVTRVDPAPPVGSTRVLDLGAYILVPGFVDIHVHGAEGAQVNAGSAEETTRALGTVAAFHARHGTTALLATAVSDNRERLLATARGVAAASPSAAAGVVGLHLEGPWISRARRGAHGEAHLRDPDEREFDALQAASEGTLRMVTMAPELPGALSLARHARDWGVRCAVGHTDADYDTTRAAIDAGFGHATHLFNAMPPMHHRAPGPAGAALACPEVTVELIADAVHLHPAVLRFAAHAAGERATLATDATAAAGVPEARQMLGDVPVHVHGGRVSLARDPSTIAGSVLTMDRALRTMTTQAGLALRPALTAATRAPADAAGLPHKGRLEPNADADAVVLDADLAVRAVLVRGRAVHDPDGLLRPQLEVGARSKV